MDTCTMRTAAEFWSQARKIHEPTAPKDALDGDVILAAQAIRGSAIVITENAGHLSRFVETKDWRDLLPTE